MQISWGRKKSGWERVLDPVTSRMKGRTLTVNGKELTGETVARGAARVVGTAAVATLVSAAISSVRKQGEE